MGGLQVRRNLQEILGQKEEVASSWAHFARAARQAGHDSTAQSAIMQVVPSLDATLPTCHPCPTVPHLHPLPLAPWCCPVRPRCGTTRGTGALARGARLVARC